MGQCCAAEINQQIVAIKELEGINEPNWSQTPEEINGFPRKVIASHRESWALRREASCDGGHLYTDTTGGIITESQNIQNDAPKILKSSSSRKTIALNSIKNKNLKERHLQVLREAAPGISDHNLNKFLCYKGEHLYHSLNSLKAHRRWRFENCWIDNPPLRAHSDPVLLKLLESGLIVQPEGMIDKLGRPCVLVRPNKYCVSDGGTPHDFSRCALYHIERLLERRGVLDNGVTLVFDFTESTEKNIQIGILKSLIPALSGEKIPLHTKSVVFIDPPWFFSVLTAFFSSKLQSRIEFLKSFRDLNQFFDLSKLPEEFGGQLKHCQMKWVQEQIELELTGELDLLECLVAPKNLKRISI